ncbi:MAG: hypothetical protein ACRD01_01785 [Terriglobales bacterium]
MPSELVKAIDTLVGPRGRSEFLAQVAQREVNKRMLLKFLSNPEPVMKDEDHPELARLGTAEWVRRLRGHPPSEPPARRQSEPKKRQRGKPRTRSAHA